MEAVRTAMWELVVEVGRAINAAEDAVQVTMALHQLASLLHNAAKIEDKDTGNTKPASLASSLKAVEEISTLIRERASQAFPETPSEEVLRRAFYNGPCFASLAQLLLRKVAVDWFACFSLWEKAVLFDKFFTEAPLSQALSALVLGLSHDEVPEDEDSFPVGSHGVACAQSERLLVLILISGQGVKNLALSLSAPNEVVQEAASIRRGGLATNPYKNSQLAQLLSSMPDRTSLQAPTALQSPFYVQSVVSQLLSAAEKNWTSLPQNGGDSLLSSSDETLKFVGEVIGGLCRRGHADVIASQMVPILMQHLDSTMESHKVAEKERSRPPFEFFVERQQMSFWPLLAASIIDSHALERLSEALIEEIASNGNVRDWQACCCLHTLYGKLFKERATTRSLFTEKFLFAKILPIRCLKWVLDFAILQSPPSSEHWVQPEENGSRVQKNVVRRLAEEWATKEFIQSASVQKQAYRTAALGMCLGTMNKGALDGINDFVPSLLKGISNRLDSPLVPVRNMAKRIALAFSIAMDPSNPLLFDENDNVEELLDWEGPEQPVCQKFSDPINTLEEEQSSAKLEVDDDLREVVISHGDDRALKHERRMRRKEKKERLALEEDDPDAIVRLGEVSLDDDECDEESSESDSDSDSKLKPYDMSEDEDDVERGKFVTQLADLPINLRKGDKPDAVLEALQVAEKFILAKPEELENLAADLTHALVHVKPSGVAIEGEEDIAEERRQRALLALLSCNPIQTVSVLTGELFSQHVDASQRILILDIMAAGARLLASGSQGDMDDRKKRSQLITNISRTTDLDSWYAPGDTSGPTGVGPWLEVSSPVPWGSLVGLTHRYERELPRKPGERPLGRSRRWGHRAMQLRKDESIRNSNQARKNRFAPLAAAFMLPVMREYDRKRRGLDLLGRDFHIFGGVLSMLGVCIECISMQREAPILGAGLLELLRSREVASHPEPFVRRTALFAASRVLVALHPSDVSTSLTTGTSGLVANLEWVREWALDIAMNDVDADCSMMATACVQLHSEMALQVQRTMGSLEPPGQALEAKILTHRPIIMPYSTITCQDSFQ